MRVLFLTLYPEDAASSRYRVHQFVPYLEAHGIQCTVAAPLSAGDWQSLTGPGRKQRPFWYHFYETSTRFRQLFSIRQYDLVVLQKGLTTASVRGLDTLLYALAKRVVYDMDDAVHLQPPQPLGPRWRWLMDPRQVSALMKRSEGVLAGNRWLVQEVEAVGGQAHYFPTVVDTDRFIPPLEEPREYTLGWMGSPSTIHALDILLQMDPYPDVRLKVVAGGKEQLHLTQSTIEPWRYDTEVDALQNMSVGIMPLHTTPWDQGKCALKALQYMACGRPVIATPFGAVCDVMDHLEHGYFADSPGEWAEAIDALRDPGHRRQLGAQARARIEEKFSLAHAAPRLCQLLETRV